MELHYDEERERERYADNTEVLNEKRERVTTVPHLSKINQEKSSFEQLEYGSMTDCIKVLNEEREREIGRAHV